MWKVKEKKISFLLSLSLLLLLFFFFKLLKTVKTCFQQSVLTKKGTDLIFFSLTKIISKVLFPSCFSPFTYPFNQRGCWGTKDNFTTSFLHFPLFSTALWDLANARACPFPDVVFPPLPLSILSSSPFHCALRDGFGHHRTI